MIGPQMLSCALLATLITTAKTGGKRGKVCAGTIRIIPANETCPPPNGSLSERIVLPPRDDIVPQEKLKQQPRIFGGMDAEESGGTVQFIAFNTKTKDANVCGGVVVTAKGFITAAHCVFQFNELAEKIPHDWQLRIYFGSTEFDKGQALHIKKIEPHSGFEYYGNIYEPEYDLAFVTVVESFPPSAIIPLPTKPKKIGAFCSLSGFGTTVRENRHKLMHSNVLQTTSIKILAKEVHLLDDSFLGSEGASVGDSGNGLLCSENGRHVISGIQTGIITDGDVENPVFLDTYHFRRWLKEMIEKSEQAEKQKRKHTDLL